MQEWKPLMEFRCGVCGETSPEQQLRKCGKCRLACYCSKECQTTAWPWHKHLCKQAATLTGGRSYGAEARNCARAIRCFEVMGMKDAELHPIQRARLVALREAVDFIEHGQKPPAPMPCFNPACQKPAELFEFNNEQALREFVLTGLCASCQATMLKVSKEAAGGERKKPRNTPAANKPTCIWTGTSWETLRPGIPLRCCTTLFADGDAQEEPRRVAGEAFKIDNFWEVGVDPRIGKQTLIFAPGPNRPPGCSSTAQVGDGEVTCIASSGRKFTVPMRDFRAKAHASELELCFASTGYSLVGCVTPAVSLSLEGLPDGPEFDWVLMSMLVRVPGLNVEKLRIFGTSSVEETAKAFNGRPMSRTILSIMQQDTMWREAGSFEGNYAKIGVQRRPRVVFPASKAQQELQQQAAQSGA